MSGGRRAWLGFLEVSAYVRHRILGPVAPAGPKDRRWSRLAPAEPSSDGGRRPSFQLPSLQRGGSCRG